MISAVILYGLIALSLGKSTLDPHRLYHWRTKWSSNPIELTQTNMKATAVGVSFYVSPSTTISNGWVQVDFPTDFDVSGVTCDQTL